jgi:DNA-binding NtrC family response regulator
MLSRVFGGLRVNLFPFFGLLIVDDEPAWIRSLALTLESAAGINNIDSCTDSRKVMDILAEGKHRIMLLDLNMPNLRGDELLRQVKEKHPEVTVIMISGVNLIESAVECMKYGASDFFVKTDPVERMISGILNAVKIISLENENKEISSRLISGTSEANPAFSEIKTEDDKMLAIFSYVEAVAKSPHPLLITGESGTGKELLAKATHKLSGRKGNLVTVNVAGLDDTMFADTLFGHVKGAFTGAETVRKGLIETATGGTLLLDEIGDLSMASQVKLLRLLQEGEYFRLGSDEPCRTNVRIIAATHADLTAKESEGLFRKDLYYRLRTHHVHLPPLREHMADIVLLTEHFLEEASQSLNKKKPTPPKELYNLLASYDFPGNIRELRAMIFNAVSVHQSGVLSLEEFIKAMNFDEHSTCILVNNSDNPFSSVRRLPHLTEAAEMLVQEALKRSEGNQSTAARLLGISQPALSKRLKSKDKQ